MNLSFFSVKSITTITRTKNPTTKRNVFKGYSDLFGLSNGIYEEQDTNYEEQENKLFEVNVEI